MLRRSKATVEADVPPREELTVFIPLTEAQRFWTYRLLTKMDTLDLEQIFSANIEGAASEGRREVLSHLVNQVEETRSGSQDAGRKCATGFTGSLMDDTSFFRVEEADESFDATA